MKKPAPTLLRTVRRAAVFARIHVAAIPTAVRPSDIRKSFLIGHIVGVHAVAQQRHQRSIERSARRSCTKSRTRTPATTRSAMSVTSSETRRPLGNTALSPANNPRRFREAFVRRQRPRCRCATGPPPLGRPNYPARQSGPEYCTSGSRSVRGGSGTASPCRPRS